MAIAYIGLGANLGDRLRMLQRALDALSESVDVRLVSSVYETSPVGRHDQPDFLNAVAKIETDLAPRELLNLVLSIEERLGRRRKTRWGPRLIDLDVLSYEQHICREPDLVLPHPRMHQRAFVLVPLAEIAPRFGHPLYHETPLRLAAAHAPQQRVTKTTAKLKIPCAPAGRKRPRSGCPESRGKAASKE